MTDILNLTYYGAVNVGGTAVDWESISTSHGKDQPIGQATIQAIKPLPAGVDIGSPVQITGGYFAGMQSNIFRGRVSSFQDSFSDSGNVVSLKCEGELWKMKNPQEDAVDLEYSVPTKLSDIIRVLLDLRSVSPYLVDEIRTSDLSMPAYLYIRFGGNLFVGDEAKIIPSQASLLSWATQKVSLFGYYLYDTPSGQVRVSRVSGKPSGTPVATFTEGLDIYSVTRNVDSAQIYNYIEVLGAKYLDTNAVPVQIRSVPAVVPSNADINPPGYRKLRVSDNWIVRTQEANSARLVKELDYGARLIEESWETWGNPDIQPGDVISIVSPSTNPNYATDNLRWVTSVSHSITDRGWNTSLTAWAGGGTILPQANDCATQPIGSGATFHIGDQVRPNFNQPNPYGIEAQINFTVASTYTSLSLSGYIHGSNSPLYNDENGNKIWKNLSRVEVWQSGVRISSVDLPAYYDSPLDSYASIPTNWVRFTIPLAGTLVAGTAQIRIIAGEGVDLQTGKEFDDFEVTGMSVRTCGIGQPVLP